MTVVPAQRRHQIRPARVTGRHCPHGNRELRVRRLDREIPFEPKTRASGGRMPRERHDQPGLRLQHVREPGRARIVELVRDHRRIHERGERLADHESRSWFGPADRPERVPEVEVGLVLRVEEVELDVGEERRDVPGGICLDEHARLPRAQREPGVTGAAADGDGRDLELVRSSR